MCTITLCVMEPRTLNWDRLTSKVEEHNDLWKNNLSMDADKVVHFLSNNLNQLMNSIIEQQETNFQAIPLIVKLNSKILMWVNISFSFLVAYNMYFMDANVNNFLFLVCKVIGKN